MKIGINTLWLKHKKVGGIESYLFNLLDGIFKIDKQNKYIIISSNENKILFEKYNQYSNIKIICCEVDSNKVISRLFKENVLVNSIAKQFNVDIMFNPVYSKPLFTSSNVPYITTIHDLQALHYPEYFSILKRIWLKFAWKNAINSSSKIVAISNFVRDDIIEKFKIDETKITTIYNPIKIENFIDDFSIVSKKYGVEKNSYYYTVSSMYKHKNLITLLKVMKEIKNNYPSLNSKLIISGISGNANQEFNRTIKELKIEDMIITTGFINDSERNILYKNCSMFLFPSIFEGFGMPPIEAMMLGKKVITTKKTCIEEVTKNLATYVENPFDEKEWIDKIIETSSKIETKYIIDDYKVENVASKYISIFEEVYNGSR